MGRFVDWSYGTVDLHAVKAAGYVGIARYLSLSPGKNITPAEAHQARSLGLDVVLVWETTAARSTEGAAAGRNDGVAASQQARTIGYPQGATIYAACDSDTNWTRVSSYQGSFNMACAQWGYHGDIYGGYPVVKGAVDARFSVTPWQTSAWSAGQIHPMAVLYQDQYNMAISGVQCDTNQVRGPVPGWAAHAPSPNDPPPPTAGDDMEKVLYVPNDTKRTKRLYLGGGRVGAPMSAAAAQAYQELGVPLDPISADTYDILVNQSS